MNVPISSRTWEPVFGSSRNSQNSTFSSNNADRLHSSSNPFPGYGGGGGGSFINNYAGGPALGFPPPLPPRPPNQTRPIYSALSTYNRSPYPSYNNSLYSNYTSSSPLYNPYNTPNGMYNRMPGYYGQPPSFNGIQPTFSELVEESSASTFQSIESFVSAFGSISGLLESTFQAVYSSFRAVIEVADHLGRVKQVLQTLAIFRFMRWVFRRIMYLIGLSKIKPEQIESIWNSLSSDSETGSIWTEKNFKPKNTSIWPIITFISFVFGGPYFIWKLINSLNLNSSRASSGWAFGADDHFAAVPEYDFEPANDRELKLRKGSKIRLAPASLQPEHIKGWALGSDGVKIGLLPINYIKVLGKISGNSISLDNSVNVPSVSQNMLPNSPALSRSSSQSTIKANETPSDVNDDF